MFVYRIDAYLHHLQVVTLKKVIAGDVIFFHAPSELGYLWVLAEVDTVVGNQIRVRFDVYEPEYAENVSKIDLIERGYFLAEKRPLKEWFFTHNDRIYSVFLDEGEEYGKKVYAVCPEGIRTFEMLNAFGQLDVLDNGLTSLSQQKLEKLGFFMATLVEY